MSPRAVFLDKDGTLLEDLPYNVDPHLMRPADGALKGLRLLQDAGYQLIVVSNQSGVARGYFTEQDLLPVERRLRAMLRTKRVALLDFYYCPHHPQGSVPQYAVECDCRKPRPGMLHRAAKEHNIDLAASWLVGDILNDVEAGNAAGCRTVLLNNGHETEWQLTPARRPDYIVKDLLEAARAIISVDEVLGWRFPHGNTAQRSPANH